MFTQKTEKHMIRIFIAFAIALFPSVAFGQLEINATVGGFRISSEELTAERGESRYFIKTREESRFTEAIAFVNDARKERNSELSLCLDKVAAKVVASQPRFEPRRSCSCNYHPCRDCSKPGPIPTGLGVQRWLNCEKTSFMDQCNRRWNWCSKKCVWVDP
jgi:hypothetical protein